MRYIGQFKSVHENKGYTVEIVTNGNVSATVELQLGPTPFVTEMSASGDTIYTPMKSSSATIQLVDNKYRYDLYSSTAKQNTVKLYDSSSNVLWTGYTQPNAYSLPYNFEYETYEIEALDGLGVLQYYDYEIIGSKKSFVTFRDIINKFLTTAGCYTHWYFSTCTSIENKSGAIPDLMTISEQNFFDEDEKAMKMNEVLEEICKFCGVTCFAHGTSVYFVDYDAIKAGINTYYKYSVGSTSHTTVTVSYSKTITKNDYSLSDSTLSLENTYTKVLVKDNLYSLDSVVPDLFEDEDLRNIKGYPWASDGDNWNDGFEGYTSGGYIGGKTSGKNAVWSGHPYFLFWSRFYTNKKFTHYYYTLNGSQTTPNFTAEQSTGKAGFDDGARYTYPTMINNTVGALFCKMDVDVRTGDSGSDSWSKAHFGPAHRRYEFKNYLLFHLNDHSNENQKLLEINQNNYDKPFFISNKARILITGSVQPDDRENCPIPLSNYKEARDDFSFYSLYIKTGIKCGNYYYNGSNWTTSASTFNLPFYNVDEITTSSRGDHFNGQEFSISDNAKLSDMSESAGYVIKLPNYPEEEQAIANVPQFSFYGRARIDADYRLDRLWMKEFDVKYYMPYEGSKDENNTDTEYEYNIDTDYVNELSDITFKICTWDKKQVNYSAVAYDNSGTYKFVDRLVNSATGETVRAEQQLCFRIVNQYKDPAKKLVATLFHTIPPYALVSDTVMDIAGPVSMIVDSMSVDYGNDSATYTLIEKK